MPDRPASSHGVTRLERAWHDLQARAEQEGLDLVTAAYRPAVERVVAARQLRDV